MNEGAMAHREVTPLPKGTEPESRELGRAPKAGQGLSCLQRLPSKGGNPPYHGKGQTT